jgi:hypothetical protein
VSAVQKDFDVIIEQIHAGERAGLIEFPDKISDVTLQSILADISREASGLSESAILSFSSAVRQDAKITLPVTRSSPPEKLRRIDRLMKKIPGYKALRPLLKRKFNPSPYSIDGLTLLKYNNKEFVRAAYLGILGRPAEQADIANFTIPIVTGDLSKIQCIDILLRSEEHSQKNIGVSGLGRKRFIEKFRRKIFKIPILGYLFRLLSNILLLSRKLKQLNRRLALLEYSLKETNEELFRIKSSSGKKE